MPVIPALAWILGIGGVGIGTGAGIYKASDNTSSAIKDNVIPLAIIAASTFLALNYMKKRQ